VIVGWSKNAIGVDVEPLDTLLEDSGISQILLHPNETKFLGMLPKKDLNRKYLELFVLKESFLKLQGTGFLVDPNQVEIKEISKGTYTAIHKGARKNCINLYNLSKIWLIATAIHHP
jgi:phosphopantetheinyl transferase